MKYYQVLFAEHSHTFPRVCSTFASFFRQIEKNPFAEAGTKNHINSH